MSIKELMRRIEKSKLENEAEIARAQLALKENRKFKSECTMTAINNETDKRLLERFIT